MRGKTRVRASDDWFWFYFWLVKKVARIFLTNQRATRLRTAVGYFFKGPELFRCTGPDWLLFTWNRLEPVQVFTRDLYGAGPESFQTDPKLDLQNSRSSFKSVWIRSRSVPERSRVNRRPLWSENRTGSIWIRLEPARASIALEAENWTFCLSKIIFWNFKLIREIMPALLRQLRFSFALCREMTTVSRKERYLSSPFFVVVDLDFIHRLETWNHLVQQKKVKK